MPRVCIGLYSGGVFYGIMPSRDSFRHAYIKSENTLTNSTEEIK